MKLNIKKNAIEVNTLSLINKISFSKPYNWTRIIFFSNHQIPLYLLNRKYRPGKFKFLVYLFFNVNLILLLIDLYFNCWLWLYMPTPNVDKTFRAVIFSSDRLYSSVKIFRSQSSLICSVLYPLYLSNGILGSIIFIGILCL